MRSFSQYGQDLAAIKHSQFKRGGYYVDIGSHDGKNHSNTYILDQMGWAGLCVEPFMTNMEKRTCSQQRTALGSKTRRQATFYGANNEIGGLAEFAGSPDHNEKWSTQVQNLSKTKVDVETVRDVFTKHGVPAKIDYMSLDVEGAEVDILKAFPFDTHCVKFATIEFNGDTRKAANIKSILAPHGYVYGGIIGHHKSGVHDFPVDMIFTNTCTTPQ